MNDECKLSKRQLNSSRKKYQEAIRSHVKENIKTNLGVSILKTEETIIKYAENRKGLTGLSKNKILITSGKKIQKNSGTG